MTASGGVEERGTGRWRGIRVEEKLHVEGEAPSWNRQIVEQAQVITKY